METFLFRVATNQKEGVLELSTSQASTVIFKYFRYAVHDFVHVYGKEAAPHVMETHPWIIAEVQSIARRCGRNPNAGEDQPEPDDTVRIPFPWKVARDLVSEEEDPIFNGSKIVTIEGEVCIMIELRQQCVDGYGKTIRTPPHPVKATLPTVPESSVDNDNVQRCDDHMDISYAPSGSRSSYDDDVSVITEATRNVMKQELAALIEAVEEDEGSQSVAISTVSKNGTPKVTTKKRHVVKVQPQKPRGESTIGKDLL